MPPKKKSLTLGLELEIVCEGELPQIQQLVSRALKASGIEACVAPDPTFQVSQFDETEYNHSFCVSRTSQNG